jgi:nucleotide-binding universal stress UspA family protein
MKTILLPIHEDDGSEARLQVALDLARADGAHLDCLQVTPFNAYVASDMLGGVFVLPDLIDAVNEQVSKLRSATEARLSREDVSWSYGHLDGDPALTIVDRSTLADLIILSPALREPKPGQPLPIAGDVAIHARTPVMVVPMAARGFDVSARAMVAWNGSPEAANALKAALPLLRRASAVDIVTIDEGDADTLPPTDACEYLARHGIKSQLSDVALQGRSVADALLAERERSGAGYIVMGAYGHSRFRELVLGGVTREMLRRCSVPILLAH